MKKSEEWLEFIKTKSFYVDDMTPLIEAYGSIIINEQEEVSKISINRFGKWLEKKTKLSSTGKFTLKEDTSKVKRIYTVEELVLKFFQDEKFDNYIAEYEEKHKRKY